MKKCIICGTPGGPDDQVCPVCGNALIDIDQTEGLEAVASQEAEALKDNAEKAAETLQKEDLDALAGEQPAAPVQGTPSAKEEQPVQQATQQAARPQQPAGQQAQQPVRPRPARRPQQAQDQRPEGTMVQHRQGTPRRPQSSAQMRQGNLAAALKKESRGMIRSPLFIFMTLLGLVYIVSSYMSVFLTQRNYGDIVTVLQRFNVPEEIMNYISQGVGAIEKIGSGAIVLEILQRVPDLLVVLGAVILIFTASKKKPDMPAGGFTLIKISLIIQMICSFALLVAGLVYMVALTVSAWVSGTTTELVITVIFLVLMIVICMIIIMYYFCHLHSRKVVLRNTLYGEDYGDVSRYAAVLTILSALAYVVSLLSAIVNNELYSIVSNGAKMAWLLFLGIWMLVYRSHFEDDEE